MERKRFLIVEYDEKERANIKEICKEQGYRAVCVDTPHDAVKYIPYFTDFDFMIIDVDLPNDYAILLCRKIKNESPETFIMGLRSQENQITHIFDFDTLLFKPLRKYVLEMVLNDNKMS